MDKFSQLYGKLNASQKLAVDTIDGPVLVLAGPGTGKTQVLALRIANILRKTQMNAYNILCLTFTDSAAYEMRKRLTGIIGTTAYDVNINTFHGFANSVIQEFPHFFNLKSNQDDALIDFQPLDDYDRLKIIEGLLTQHHWKYISPLKSNLIHLNQISKHIQEFKRERISPKYLIDEAIKRIESLNVELLEENLTKTKKASLDIEIKKCQRTIELGNLYKYYNKKLSQSARYDYEDMINWVVDALTDDPELALIYQEKYQYILVDEFQDTNNSQLQLLNLLTSFYQDNPNLFVVGDPNQCIYRFQGASTFNIEYLVKKYSKITQIALTTNYRSGQNIIDASHKIIENNQKQLRQSASNKTASKVDLYNYQTSDQESYQTAKLIKKLIKNTNPEDIAILVRNNNQIHNYIQSLSVNKIPFKVVRGDSVLNHPYIEKILSLVEILVDPTDKKKFSRLLYLYRENFSYQDIFSITNHLFSQTKLTGISKKSKNFLEYIDIVAGKISEFQPAVALSEIFDQFDITKNILRNPDRLERMTLVKSLFDNAKLSNLTLPEWVAKIREMQTYGLDLSQESILYGQDVAVTISTIHQAKGKEYQVVFMPELQQNIWSKVNRSIFMIPNLTSNIDEHQTQIEEERRLFYVGCTRAKKKLVLSYSNSNNGRDISPSRYILELPDNVGHHTVQENETNATARIKTQLSITPNLTLSQRESAWLKQLVAKQHISPTGFTTYKNCPRNYFYKNVLRVPQVKNISQSYGTAIHTALEKYFIEFGKTEIMPPLNFLITQFDNAIELENQLTSIEKLKYKHDGNNLLTKFYNTKSSEFLIPVKTEYSFQNIYLGDIPISGKIDKIEWLNQSENTVRVVDYKTGTSKSRNALLGLTKDKNTDYLYQLKFYQLLSEIDHRFYLKWKIGECSLEFLDDKSHFPRQSFIFSQSEIDELKLEIKKVWREIQALKFDHNPDANYGCEYCELFN